MKFLFKNHSILTDGMELMIMIEKSFPKFFINHENISERDYFF